MHPPSMLLLLGATSVAQATNQNKPRPRNVMPTAIKKMPPDQGAKFYPHYVAFPDTDNDDSRIFLAARSRTWHNISSLNLDQISPLAPFAPHLLRDISPNPLRRSLQERQWACPSDTHSCDAIGYPNSCCWEGTTCMVVPDTGLGPVGCCPEGARRPKPIHNNPNHHFNLHNPHQHNYQHDHSARLSWSTVSTYLFTFFLFLSSLNDPLPTFQHHGGG
ncbi:uncharacterized protein CTHT_0051710 [Thermochaetoides thermophila DSM 1495]|uniref:Uncharacterized protein n=1 Tax=Chaetomium thermophilum (strain DSM 1495 / CBS 144.50 / IMI 039719) TaxID=759272 RepID=G0SDG6_CHATD|nr:hypothetical protein CTHT_0051710 [Thermochaetoides thermophila DSM 1495]EGS18567.1 hypothetical protein CTHT_0051710 [Thermochaetoides thermophila DSM 1495]